MTILVKNMKKFINPQNQEGINIKKEKDLNQEKEDITEEDHHMMIKVKEVFPVTKK